MSLPSGSRTLFSSSQGSPVPVSHTLLYNPQAQVSLDMVSLALLQPQQLLDTITAQPARLDRRCTPGVWR